ncbi:MAG: peptidase T [Planctomycetaceae bacterium]
MDRQRLLDRFLQYVKIDTTAVEDSGQYPSSPGQLELGKLLVEQMQAMGIADATQNEYGIVMGTVPGNVENAPVVCFNSHVDTSPETTGKNVKPNVIENFDGNDITLPGDPSKIITAATCKELPDAKGKTIITTDGTTLLGGDDKAGVAIIMELANHLIENPDTPRGDVRLLFTCDEEIGHGVDHVDIDKVNATVCYNFDSGEQNKVDSETFSADMAQVTFRGVNIHPAIAKDKMVNSMRAAGHFLARMPADLSPERTEGREGFLHPYVLDGGVAETTLKVLLRDFDSNKLSDYAEILTNLAKEVEVDCPETSIDIEIIRQYRNMADGLVNEPRAVAIALKAHEALGRTPEQTIVRGGTDGSRLTELGLPTPNLSSGQHNIHSPLEWACLDEMYAACEVGVEIVKLWSNEN